MDLIRRGDARPDFPMAHQLRLSPIRPHHVDGRYPYDGGVSHHDGDPSLRDVGLEPAAIGRKARKGRMT